MSAPLLEVVDLVKLYALARPGWFAPHPTRRAVDGVGFVIEAGRSFGVVGESGSGKSTLARAVMALERPTSGVVRLEGRSLYDLPRRRAARHARAHPDDLPGPLRIARSAPENRAHRRRAAVEPRARHARRARRSASRRRWRGRPRRRRTRQKYPHEFSGGQRQRIAIARALITRPKLVVADEPVSALDVSIQAQVLNLMSDLQREAGVTYLVISHDLAVVGHICDEIAVMFRGRFVETGPSAALLAKPAHPYTRELVDAEPKLEETPLPPPSRRRGPTPRRAAPTRRAASSRRRAASKRRRALRALGEGRRVACHFPL